jgi:hypothetical protein
MVVFQLSRVKRIPRSTNEVRGDRLPMTEKRRGMSTARYHQIYSQALFLCFLFLIVEVKNRYLKGGVHI